MGGGRDGEAQRVKNVEKASTECEKLEKIRFNQRRVANCMELDFLPFLHCASKTRFHLEVLTPLPS